MATKVSEDVLEGIKAVRDSGALNMFDYKGVMAMAESLGFDETAAWMRAHKKEYAEGIFQGFEIGETDTPLMN